MAIRIREETVDLFGGREDLRILHITDVHVWTSTKVLDELRSLIVATKPDLLIFTGDYFDLPRGARLVREFMTELGKAYPLVYIRGNHDLLWGKRIADWFRTLPNCHSVEEAIFEFRSPRGHRYRFGSWPLRDRFSREEECRNLLLIHNPEHLDDAGLDGIDLVFAGHLHGGQFILFPRANRPHFPASLVYRFCIDRTKVKETTIIVSKGVSDTLPLRWNCPREVVLVQIR